MENSAAIGEGGVLVTRAGASDAEPLGRLLWRWTSERATPGQSEDAYAADFQAWFDDHSGSHVAFLAHVDGAPVGMAWLAVLARVPRPIAPDRRCGDIQSVYVTPRLRSQGIGAALLRAVLQHARDLGLEHVTVHSSARAVPAYERAGLASSRTLLGLFLA